MEVPSRSSSGGAGAGTAPRDGTATADHSAQQIDETAALQRAFRRLCNDYEELLDEATNGTQPVDERIGLALFKIDEACGVTDVVRADAEQVHEQIMDALLDNCHELEDIFLRINIMERFVGKVQETTRELEKRMDSTSRAAGPVFNAGSVTSLLRSFSKRVGAEAAVPAGGATKWEPVAFDFNTKELMQRLDKGDARELGVSISSSSASSAAPSAANSLLAAIADMHQQLPSSMRAPQMHQLFQ